MATILIFRSFKYWLLLRKIKVDPGKDTYLITNFGYFTNLISPIRISEISRSLVVKKITGKHFFKILAPTTLDTLFDVIIIVFVILVSSIFVALDFDYQPKLILIVIFATIAILGMSLILTKKGEKISIRFLNYATKKIMNKDVSRTSREFISSSRKILSDSKLLFSVFLVECFVWILEGLKLYWLGLAAGVDIGLPVAIFIISIAYLLGGAFVNPSGLTQETILLLLLTQLPFEKTTMTLVGSLDAIVTVGFIMTVGLIFILKFGIKNLNLNKIK
jgi:uncharacterized protein (TIRG00374 family)